jgi:hypothetical protein
VALAIYVVVLDFAAYWHHRFQHRIGWWWALHSLHHAQTQMTFWTDDRNHILDDVLAAAWFGVIAVLIGVPPGQFPVILLILRLGESLSHANVRLDFGRFGERLLVSPRFHRLHHGVLSTGTGARTTACCCRSGTGCSARLISDVVTTPTPAIRLPRWPIPTAGGCASRAPACGNSGAQSLDGGPRVPHENATYFRGSLGWVLILAWCAASGRRSPSVSGGFSPGQVHVLQSQQA